MDKNFEDRRCRACGEMFTPNGSRDKWCYAPACDEARREARRDTNRRAKIVATNRKMREYGIYLHAVAVNAEVDKPPTDSRDIQRWLER